MQQRSATLALPALSATLTCSTLSALCSNDGSQHHNQPDSCLAATSVYDHTKRDRSLLHLRRELHIMDGLSGAASVIAVIDISAKIASLCLQYSKAVKDAKDDIERVQRKVGDIAHILEQIKQLLDSQDKTRLSTTQGLFSSLTKCLKELEDLQAELVPGKSRKTMSRFGLRALKWPFTSQQVDKIVSNLEGYEQAFILALQVDQT